MQARMRWKEEPLFEKSGAKTSWKLGRRQRNQHGPRQAKGKLYSFAPCWFQRRRPKPTKVLRRFFQGLLGFKGFPWSG
jgi:hypothetical protein